MTHFLIQSNSNHKVIADLFFKISFETKKKKSASRLVFCTGKVYYEVDAIRKQKNDTSTAIVRLEVKFQISNQ